MKKNLLAASAAGLFIFMSCKDATTGTVASDNSGMANMAKNRAVFKAIETGDSLVIDSLISGDALDHMGPAGGELKGDSIKYMLTDMHNHIKNLKITVLSEAANGDYVFAMEQMTGIATDNTMGVPAGTKMDETGVDVVKLKDGKMVEHWAYVDANEMAKMMKQMPPMSEKMMKDSMMEK